MEQYLLLMIYEMDNIAGHGLPKGDQAHHNVLYYTGQLEQQEGIDRVRIFANYEGVVGTIGKKPVGQPPINLVLQNNNTVMGTDGGIVPLVHMFDRYRRLERVAKKKMLQRLAEAEIYLNMTIDYKRNE